MSKRPAHILTIRAGSVGRPTIVDTNHECAGCHRYVTVVRDGDSDRWYSECGGEGEGGCNAWIDGDEAAQQSHQGAVAHVEMAFSPDPATDTSCTCEEDESGELVQRGGRRCPWHGTLDQARAQSVDPDQDDYPHRM